MFNRLCAISLIVLAAVPFTAPFATLDWSDFVGRSHSCNVLEVAAPVASSHHDRADDAASLGACVQRVQPVGLSILTLVASPVARGATTAAAATFAPVTSCPPWRDSSTLTALLRV
jgi:hypothetical protein